MVSIRDQALGRLQKFGATPAQAGIIIGNLNKMDLNKVLSNDDFAKNLVRKARGARAMPVKGWPFEE